MRRFFEGVVDVCLTFGFLAGPVLIVLALAKFAVEYPAPVLAVGGAFGLAFSIIRGLK